MHNTLLTLRLVVEHVLLMQQSAAAAHATATQADAGMDVEAGSSAAGEAQVSARNDREHLRGVRWEVCSAETSCFILTNILQLTKPARSTTGQLQLEQVSGANFRFGVTGSHSSPNAQHDSPDRTSRAVERTAEAVA